MSKKESSKRFIDLMARVFGFPVEASSRRTGFPTFHHSISDGGRRNAQLQFVVNPLLWSIKPELSDVLRDYETTQSVPH